MVQSFWRDAVNITRFALPTFGGIYPRNTVYQTYSQGRIITAVEAVGNLKFNGWKFNLLTPSINFRYQNETSGIKLSFRSFHFCMNRF
jgi:hypothetical protein